MFTDNHISVIAAKDIDEICQPLFNYSNITFFNFMRVFADRSYITLSSNAKFVKKLSAVVWPPKDIETANCHVEFMRYVFICNIKQIPSCFKPLLREFNIENGLIVRDYNAFYEDRFLFTTQYQDFNIYEFCFNNIDFIEKFIFYFKDKASLIIKKATVEQRLHYPEAVMPKIEPTFIMPSTTILSENIKVRKYIFNLSERFICLSAQEMNSVRLLAKGCTVKEAAQHLGISPRTVIYYLQCAREKLEVRTNRQLISIYWERLSLA